MHNFTPISAILGGALIGFAATMLLILNGRITGVGGIVGSLLKPAAGDRGWRIAFIAGLVAGPLLVQLLTGQRLAITIESNIPMLVAGGLLVGFGASLGSDWSDGHEESGISRLSPRSLFATLIFLFAGAATVFLIRHGVS
jgi:uncharacterized membrane protein YedE/YeeE